MLGVIRSGSAARYYAEHREQLQKQHPDFKATAMSNGVSQFVSSDYLPVVRARMEAMSSVGQGQAFLKSLAGSSDVFSQ